MADFSNAVLYYCPPPGSTDADLFAHIIKCQNLCLIKKVVPEVPVTKFQTLVQDILLIFQSTIDVCYLNATDTELAKLSPIEFLASMTEEMDIDLSKTSYLEQLYETPKKSLAKSKKRTATESETPGPSSITPKRKRKDTSISSIAASTTAPTAAAHHSEDSDLSEDELDTLLSLVPKTTKNSGSSGSAIFYKNQGKLYTWKSPVWTLANKYVDLKIYDHPSKLKELDPMSWWKEAGLRAKVLIGNPHSSSERVKKIEKLLKELVPLLIAEISTLPECEASVRE